MTDKSAKVIAAYLSKKVFTNELCSDGDCADGDCQLRCSVYEIDGCGHAEAILAALEAAGLVVVPVEPTDKMVEAFSRVSPATCFPLRKWAENARAAIHAAIAASKEQK